MSEQYLEWVARATDTNWWTDTAIPEDIRAAMWGGASGVTTNPCLMANAWSSSQEILYHCTPRLTPGLTGDAHAAELERTAAQYLAKELLSSWEKNAPLAGGVCCQVSPYFIHDTQAALSMAKEFGAAAPNIIVKIPTTKSGLLAAEEGIALGYNICATVGFSVSHALAAAEAFQRGEARARAAGTVPGHGYAVILIGRLDNYLQELNQDGNYGVSAADLAQAGIAVVKRTYQLFLERGYHAVLLVGGARAPYHVTELIGGRMLHTIPPSYAKIINDANPAREKTIDRPVPSDVIQRLRAIPEFNMAYDIDGLRPEQFISSPPQVKIAAQFALLGWDQLLRL